MAHTAHTLPFVGHVGHVGHVFLVDSRAENADSYTNDTVVIYSIYIFIGLYKYMAHMTHKRAFSEGVTWTAPSPTRSPTLTHTH